MDEGHRLRGHRVDVDDPYGDWFAGLFVELGSFAAFVALLALFAAIVAALI